jgi:hypothetical protein
MPQIYWWFQIYVKNSFSTIRFRIWHSNQRLLNAKFSNASPELVLLLIFIYFFVGDDHGFLKEGRVHLMSPMSSLNLPTFSVCTSIVYDSYKFFLKGFYTSRINLCFTAGKRIRAYCNFHASCKHQKTATFTSIVYRYKCQACLSRIWYDHTSKAKCDFNSIEDR